MIKLKNLLIESINEAKFSKDQIEIMKMAYGTLSGMNPSSPTYKKFIKFLDRLPKDQLKQLAAANIKFVSMLAKNRLRGESIKERSSYDSDNEIQSQIEEKAKRDYKDEYKKFQSSTKAKKYRAELNKYNRKKGTYGNGDGKDASHKGGKIAGFEKESTNRGRREKSRLKKQFKMIKLKDLLFEQWTKEMGKPLSKAEISALKKKLKKPKKRKGPRKEIVPVNLSDREKNHVIFVMLKKVRDKSKKDGAYHWRYMTKAQRAKLEVKEIAVRPAPKKFKDIYNALPSDLKKRVYNLKKYDQRRDAHPEGNVLKHTIAVTNRALQTGDIDFALAALFHDIGKDETAGIHPKKGHITHFGHEHVSAKLVKKYGKWIKSMGGNAVDIYYIVKQHMRMKVFDKMRWTKQEKMKKFRAFDKLKKFSTTMDKGGRR